ncbi:sigma 54-interacting transcriptional regulator [Geoalkalibacter halelectricus]|uniref:Sigma 54-interacting transcriptional regulator n=1 Tax=Geoalkalibacter halelectricus TaxID=2847045 RepID=A0ABY5ZU68_9BACT|nr:sigma 54-interacting transcriptional regulator [Geoalkalibacter halelectricus]MDO3376977.1 sigma 54-interacting transcriptional regulator [Geoalkalibacter halelectricus]UWZ81199.1 sigma 54-interacting transcriptional regulator [Geoalkalibacter halelectricus]
MGPIETVKERCRKCYSCVRNCPVKAIKVGPEWAEVIHARCIGCGKCLKACSQKAKVIADGIEGTRRILADNPDVVAVLGCSYPAFFNDLRPGQLVAGLKKLGFAEVHEGSAGVELIAPTYKEQIQGPTGVPLISSHCPTIVDLIERHYPQLLRNLMPVVSPMVALGRFLKERRGPQTRIIYISSCIAGKFEVASEEVAGAIDLVLTYRELSQMFRDHGIDLTRFGDAAFDGRKPDAGRLFPIGGGPFQAFGVRNDFLNPDYISTGGAESCLELVRDLAARRITPRWVDLRFCEGGCIGGPGKNNRLTTFAKRNLVINSYQHQDLPYATQDRYAQVQPLPQVRRRYSNKLKRLEPPNGESIRKILQATNKFVEQDEFDCGACGYPTCREYAVAVYQGLAEAEMCLPFSIKRLEEDRVSLTQKYELAQRALAQEYGDPAIIGNDPRTLDVLKLIRQVGPTPTTVLIRGESGTGKELTARAIHEHSNRADKPLVTVNCTTLTDSLLESELFGHKKGSFTGAIADKKGLFEAANGGTIFLDEIGDITPKLQAELLRVLDSGELKPVGGTVPHKVDVRLIAATNRNLEDGVRDGWFREDLFYRLNVFTITMPPLRSRLESLPQLVHHFLAAASKRLNKPIRGIEDRAIAALKRYHWPGNIRELQNIIERGSVLTQDNVIRLENLPVIFAQLSLDSGGDMGNGAAKTFRDQREKHLEQVEVNLVRKYLEEAGGNVSLAARKAAIPRRTFYRILARHGLKGEDFKATAPKGQ